MERGSVPTARCRAHTLLSTIWMMNMMVILIMMITQPVQVAPSGVRPSVGDQPVVLEGDNHVGIHALDDNMIKRMRL